MCINCSTFVQKAKSAFSLISSSQGASRDFSKTKDTEEEEMVREHRDENILMLIKAQKVGIPEKEGGRARALKERERETETESNPSGYHGRESGYV